MRIRVATWEIFVSQGQSMNFWDIGHNVPSVGHLRDTKSSLGHILAPNESYCVEDAGACSTNVQGSLSNRALSRTWLLPPTRVD